MSKADHIRKTNDTRKKLETSKKIEQLVNLFDGRRIR